MIKKYLIFTAILFSSHCYADYPKKIVENMYKYKKPSSTANNSKCSINIKNFNSRGKRLMSQLLSKKYSSSELEAIYKFHTGDLYQKYLRDSESMGLNEITSFKPPKGERKKLTDLIVKEIKLDEMLAEGLKGSQEMLGDRFSMMANNTKNPIAAKLLEGPGSPEKNKNRGLGGVFKDAIYHPFRDFSYSQLESFYAKVQEPEQRKFAKSALAFVKYKTRNMRRIMKQCMGIPQK